MTPRLLFLALATIVNANLQISQSAEKICSLLSSWEGSENVISSAQALWGGHERSVLLSKNCADHLVTAAMNCTKGTELLCSEFSISITKYAAQGPRSVPLVRRSQSVQASLAETGCTCPATETSPDLISSTASSFSAITASPITATGPSVSTSQVSPLSTPVESGTQNVVYWGQKGVGTVENNDLATYCNSNSGIDIIVLAFLHQYGNGQTVPSGSIGQSCSISTSGEPQQCDALGAAIQQCQSNGISVILSLGGAVGAYSLTSRQEAETIGQNLWEAYGNTDRSDIPRPFGSTFVNGWDFNLERNNGNQYYQYLISKLRSNFASDFSNTYYITGAPQCPIPEPNMQDVVAKSKFDYLWVQFYNNPGCSVNGVINYDQWASNIANTPSANATIFLGVPASPLGATGDPNGSQYYLAPSDLASLVSQHKSNNAFGGIMMWSAEFSDGNVNNGCTYAQEAKQILRTGLPC